MIRVTSLQASKARNLLGRVPSELPKALARAINRASQAARTEAAKGIRQEYIIRHGDIVSATKIRTARADQKMISATIRIRGTRRELIFFRVSPKSESGRRPRRIRVAVKKGGLKPLPGAFVRRGTKSGNPHVFRREGKARYPVHIVYGPSIPQMAANPKITEVVEQRARDMLDKRLGHEINRVLEKGLPKS